MDPFLGEIRMFGGNFAPQDWAICAGQLLSISQNDALYALLGTTYGGDGINTFALPDLRGRVPIHRGSNYALGQAGGVETVTLSAAQLPAHSHAVACASTPADGNNPAGKVLADNANLTPYSSAGPAAAMNAGVVTIAQGGGQPHDNMVPFQAVNFIIALVGIFPPRS